MEKDGANKQLVCVTGGTGYLASWIVFKLLEQGYYVNTTVRSSPGREKDLSYLTNLPGASERLRVFNADLDKPDSFAPAIEGCIGVFHVAHPMNMDGKDEEEKTNRAVNGTLGILQACLKSKTVKRVVYTASSACILVDSKNPDMVDENSWSDVEYIRTLNMDGGVYGITKIVTEKACLEFAEKHGLDLVSVIPTWIHGPFLTPQMPGSVSFNSAMLFGRRDQWNFSNLPLVHIDDAARAHVFLFEYPKAKGRYICCALQIEVDKLAEFLSARYPEYPIPASDSSKEIKVTKFPKVLNKKLLETGFKFKYGLEEIFDDLIRCSKEKGLL